MIEGRVLSVVMGQNHPCCRSTACGMCDPFPQSNQDLWLQTATCWGSEISCTRMGSPAQGAGHGVTPPNWEVKEQQQKDVQLNPVCFGVFCAEMLLCSFSRCCSAPAASSAPGALTETKESVFSPFGGGRITKIFSIGRAAFFHHEKRKKKVFSFC